jgi:hypothetical protein
MKKLFPLILLVLCLNKSFSQSIADYESIKLEEKADYKAAEFSANKAANYILSVPYEKNNEERAATVQFLFKWMSGAPDYNFNLDKTASKLISENSELLVIFMACMAKYCIENQNPSKDVKAIELNALKLLLTYCENEKNKIKMTSTLKQLSEAAKKGELEKEL